METTEKIASLYLRLNGFFLMPHFTTFVEDFKHVDLLGVRFKNSREEIGGTILDVDRAFLAKLKADSQDIKLWAEVGSEKALENLFPDQKADYVRKIFGDNSEIKKVYFDFTRDGKLQQLEDILIVPKDQCRNLILSRFAQMESEPLKSKMKRLTKEGSWRWSEEFLADLLYLRKIGFLKER